MNKLDDVWIETISAIFIVVMVFIGIFIAGIFVIDTVSWEMLKLFVLEGITFLGFKFFRYTVNKVEA